jgi:hypothetical protein
VRGSEPKEALAGFVVEQAGQFIRVDAVAETLDTVDEDDGDVVAVFFEEILILGNVDFVDEDGDVGADDILNDLEGFVAEMAAGFGHEGDLVHGGIIAVEMVEGIFALRRW